MTLAEARFPSQVDDEREAYLDRTDYGMPPCAWLYWHAPGKLSFSESMALRWKAMKRREQEKFDQYYESLWAPPPPEPDPVAQFVPIEERPVPAGLMVNRERYLWHIRALMAEWGIDSDQQFEVHRESLIRRALFRMGLL